MKLARVFICDSQDPAPQYERFRFDGIRFYRCVFPQGAWQTYRYPGEVKYADLPSCHIQISGVMTEPTGVWPAQNPGWMSKNEQFVIPAGVFSRYASTDTVRWCCTGITDGEMTDYMETIVLDQPFTLDVGQNLLVASGSVSVGGQSYPATTRLKVTSVGKLVTPLESGYAFRWRSADILGRYVDAGVTP
jgi:hypothetical protein